MPIELEPHNPEWAAQFEIIKSDFLTALEGTDYVAIEHVGSTAVPGLAAKPIIDIDIIAPTIQHVAPICRAIISQLPYEFRGALAVPDRYRLRHKEMLTIMPRRHVYVIVDGSVALRNHLGARKVLREDEALRKEYGRCKQEIATRTDDIFVYVEGKSTVLTKALRAAGTLTEDELDTIVQVNRANQFQGPTADVEIPVSLDEFEASIQTAKA